MAGETTSTTIEELIQTIKAEALLKFQATAGILDTVRVKDTQGSPGLTVDFPVYGAVASSDVTSVAEATDHATNKEISTTQGQATIADHVIMAVVTDTSLMGTKYDLVDDISRLFSNAILAKLEDDIVNLYGSFDLTVAGAATTMTIDHWYSCLQQLKAANAPMRDLYGCISPKQYWGAKGLRALLVDADAQSGQLGEDMKNKGYVDQPFGLRGVLTSNEINEDVASGGDAAGAVYAKGAVGVHTKGLFNVEYERNASLRGFEVVCVGRWGEVEIEGTWGVYFLSDVS